jgi:hypothetical protein
MTSQSTQWKPGQRPEGAGRPTGGRNRRTTEIVQKLISLGHKDPLETLSELQNSAEDEGIRATAANMLAPYLHSKMGTTPVPPDPVYIDLANDLPAPTTIDQAIKNIALLADMKAKGQLDVVKADSLIADQRYIADALLNEQKLLTAQGGPPQQTIHIEGGLPLLPGTNVIMPDGPSPPGEPLHMNGHCPQPSNDEP